MVVDTFCSFSPHFIFNHKVQILYFGELLCTNLCVISLSAGILTVVLGSSPPKSSPSPKGPRSSPMKLYGLSVS